jgi:nitroreductase
MAICPTKSVTVEGLSYESDFFDLPAEAWTEDSFGSLIASRRSVRAFQDKPVPREDLQKIVDAISRAPMGYPPHKIEIVIVQNRETIEKALLIIIGMYEKLAKMMDHSIMGFLLKRKLKPEVIKALTEHVLPSLRYRLPDMKAGRGDTITRGAPALILFHAHRASGNHSEDVLIALTYGLLSAHALGLGATAIGLVPPVIERSPELRGLFQIPAENEVLASMIVGYPKHRFKRGIRRELPGVKWI